jgi:NAD(P) transhydrogenase subunit alpha
MSALAVGVVKESAPGERRVAMVPEVVPRLLARGVDVLVETGAGVTAWQPDSAYLEAGATVVDPATLDARAEIVLCVDPPPAVRLAGLPAGRVVAGLLNARTRPELIAGATERGLTLVSLDLLPRTLSRAQPMDALTSQANVAGYQAAITAAHVYGRFFPMLMTAAGTAKPAQVLVLGAGVAGLAAIGTARRLGALVTGYDIRPETRDEVQSMGARFLDLPGAVVPDGAGTGGYARGLDAGERAAQQQALQDRIGDFDVVIATAQVPGRHPPVLVTSAAVKAMRPGSVVLDLAASPLGGNVEGSEPDRQIVVNDAVTVIGAGNLPSAMPAAASAMYARNQAALVATLVRDGTLTVDLTDEVLNALVVTHEGVSR